MEIISSSAAALEHLKGQAIEQFREGFLAICFEGLEDGQLCASCMAVFGGDNVRLREQRVLRSRERNNGTSSRHLPEAREDRLHARVRCDREDQGRAVPDAVRSFMETMDATMRNRVES